MIWPLLLAATIALLAATLLTPVVMRFMTHIGLVDCPDGRRKLHRRTVPLAGGMAIWMAGVIATVVCNQMFGSLFPPAQRGFWLSVLCATGVICLVGLADDAWNLRGRHKLLGQFAACLVVISGGLVIESIHLFGVHLALGVFAIPFTLFWLLGAINAMNLVDGMDGLASTIGGLIGLALCILAAMNGHAAEALITAALVGGVVGFLAYNLPPARVFLGDSGSMVIGLVLGIVAIRASLKSPATIALAAPIAIWTLPILDAAMAILRRRLTGRSILIPDRAHLHHRLSERGLTPKQSLLLITCLVAITTSGALLSVLWSAEWIAPTGTIAVIVFLASSRLFGHSELGLLARHARAFARSMNPLAIGNNASQQHSLRIQGTTEWDRLWESLLQFGELCGLSSIQFSVNLPSLHEQFFARWDRRGEVSSGQIYHVEIPLSSPVLGPIGSLRIAGAAGEESACLWISEMVEGLRPFELQICDLLNSTASEGLAGQQLPFRPVEATGPPAMAGAESAATWSPGRQASFANGSAEFSTR